MSLKFQMSSFSLKKKETGSLDSHAGLAMVRVELSGGCIHLTGQIATVPTTPDYLPE